MQHIARLFYRSTLGASKLLVLSLAVFMATTTLGAAQAQGKFFSEPLTGLVTYVTDGDTLWVGNLLQGGKPVSADIERLLAGSELRSERGGAGLAKDPQSRSLKLRLYGVDAPEICQTDGAEALRALKQKVLAKRVEVVLKHRDSYGRWLAQVSVAHAAMPNAAMSNASQDINAQLVFEGWAWGANPANRRDANARYAPEQRAAIDAKRGLFANRGAEHPAAFRKREGSCYERR